MWVGVLVALALSLLIGFLNGWIVVKTGIPSFLVTLGTFFMLQGLNLALTQTITNQVASPDISNMQGFSSAQNVFASSFTIGGVNIRITIIYWIVVTRSRPGSCSAPASATGSSRSAAPRPAPARSACRWPG